MRSCCELLSDFLSLFFEHNNTIKRNIILPVVNCFQIFYLCSSNTTLLYSRSCIASCELLSDFLSLFFEHNYLFLRLLLAPVVNCFQIFYLCSSNTTPNTSYHVAICCELLSDFLSLFFEHNGNYRQSNSMHVVNCFQIFYLCSSNTTTSGNKVENFSCELLSDFLSLFFEHNPLIKHYKANIVVNCFQIFYLCSSNTTEFAQNKDSQALMEIIPK